MKSFRVNLDDPCWKVLPAAMKKYEVRGKEEDYRLYITHGNTGSTPRRQPSAPHCMSELTCVERMLASHEKPLIIFQQLQKEGLNPLFMLRYAGKGQYSGQKEKEDEMTAGVKEPKTVVNGI
jgi:protein STE50